jgi:hypothetical protein
MKNIILVFTFFICFTQVKGQDYEEIKRIQDSIFQSNVKKTRINGVYIPKDLDEAFQELTALSTEESQLKFKNAQEEIVARKLHFGLGKWMRVNWNFDEGSRIVKVLRDYGLYHPDDQVNFMLRSYHRHLNNKDQEIEKRVEEYLNKRRQQLKASKLGGEILESETRPIPKEK